MHDKMFHPSKTEMAAATKAAIAALRWTCYDYDTDDMFDSARYAEYKFDSVAEKSLLIELSLFIANNSSDLDGMEYEQIGHDFILTRNHHGAGFWDRGLGVAGERLTEAAHAYSELSLYDAGNGIISAE